MVIGALDLIAINGGSLVFQPIGDCKVHSNFPIFEP